MNESTGKAHWLIEGFDGSKKIFERRIDYGQLTRRQALQLVRALAAKVGLSFDEIVGAYAKRGTRIANEHLKIHQDGPYLVFSCGTNPHFVISARNGDGVIFGKAR